MRYDIAVIGNDEAAVEMAVVAAAAGQNVVALLPEVSHSSWIMVQALKRLTVNLLADHNPARKKLLRNVTSPGIIRQLLARTLTAEISDYADLMLRNSVDVIYGESRFRTRDEVLVSTGIDCSRTVVHAGAFVLGTGMRHSAIHRALGLISVHNAESLFCMPRIPARLSICGGGSFGAGLASLFSLFGVQCEFAEDDGVDSAMSELMLETGVQVLPNSPHARFDESVAFDRSHDVVVDCRRRIGFTRHLNLPAIGVEPDENGQLWCASNFETWCPGVFGIGDVVGYGPETELSETVQARKIMNRVLHRIPRPHFLRAGCMSANRAHQTG